MSSQLQRVLGARSVLEKSIQQSVFNLALVSKVCYFSQISWLLEWAWGKGTRQHNVSVEALDGLVYFLGHYTAPE
jgi:hypothetical protein